MIELCPLSEQEKKNLKIIPQTQLLNLVKNKAKGGAAVGAEENQNKELNSQNVHNSDAEDGNSGMVSDSDALDDDSHASSATVDVSDGSDEDSTQENENNQNSQNSNSQNSQNSQNATDKSQPTSSSTQIQTFPKKKRKEKRGNARCTKKRRKVALERELLTSSVIVDRDGANFNYKVVFKAVLWEQQNEQDLDKLVQNFPSFFVLLKIWRRKNNGKKIFFLFEVFWEFTML